MRKTPDPFNLQLEQVLPGVMSTLNLLSQQITDGFAVQSLNRSNDIKILSGQLKEMKTALNPITRSLANMRFQVTSTVNMLPGTP